MTATYRFDFAWLGGDQLTRDVAISVDNDTIVAVDVDPEANAEHISGIALPGMVSAHSHAFHRGLRGQTHDAGGDFWAWRQPMYELANTLTPDSYYELAKDVYGEMLLSGMTTVGEFHYVHHRPDGSPYDDSNAMSEALIAAAEEVGIRLTLLDTLYLTSDVNGSPPLPEQRRFSDQTAESWLERVGRQKSSQTTAIGIAAHSIRSVPREALRFVADAGKELACPVHLHVSEQHAENEACKAQYGMTPIALLDDAGMLSGNVTLVHATHASAADRVAVARSGAMVCFCPTTEADLGDGIGPAIEFAEMGVDISLGSDSNAIIDPFEEMRRIEHHDRLRLQQRGLHSPAALLAMGSERGARSLGWDTGSLEVGKLADMAVLNTAHRDFGSFDAEHGLGSVVMAATRSAVSHVMVGGKMTTT